MSTGITSGLGGENFSQGDYVDPQLDLTGQKPNADGSESIRQLNSFLRGEISAAETYRMAIEKVQGSDRSTSTNIGLLREMQAEHGRAAQAIRDRIRELGGEPSDSSGAWGVWAKFTEGMATFFGDAASLKTLKEGEEHGLMDYLSGVRQIDSSSADLIQNQLIPAQRRHVDLLDQLINSLAKA